ncbi:MAG: HAD-IIIA family hydrolase [Anaerolineales bacterium]|nr:HAD-IIIA family hydrolase [Anaerolineales bacterium]
MQPAIFLDRDGVIIENRLDYVRTWMDVSIYPQALTALARIQKSPYQIVIVTNQSAIGRGLTSQAEVEIINKRIVREIELVGGRIDGVFMCMHCPEDECACRKPKPGLILQAAETLSLDLQSSLLVGDALSDIRAGKDAGIPLTVLVRTGLGAAQEGLPEAVGLKPFLIYDTLAEALADLV